MSKSRSPTPRPNILPSNYSSTLELTPSRPQTYENTIRPVEAREQQFTSRPTFHSLEPYTPENRSSQLRSPQNSPDAEQPMAKRLRRGSPSRGESSSMSSSDSQDGSAYAEMEAGPSQQSQSLPPTTNPPKKKRTRTLTTPHQSAVLHALLAQSRFPTTAMREEVGQSIGLSARKVQIWFQNQRQKARRPPSQSETALHHPPQYGPFPNAQASVSVGSFPVVASQSHHVDDAGPSGSSFDDRRAERPAFRPRPPSEAFPATLEPTPQLLGPGMPGSDLNIGATYRPQPYIIPGPSSPMSNYSTSQMYIAPRHPTSLNPQDEYIPRSTSLQTPLGSMSHEVDFSRTLPPLIFGPSQSQRGAHESTSHDLPRPFSRSNAGLLSPLDTARASSPGSIFAHSHAESSARSPADLPPPYTLQPRPQWENPSFASVLRPTSSAWSRPDSRSNGDNSPTPPGSSGRDFTREEEETPPTEPVQPARSGRYDPVRATFVSYPATPSPATEDQHASEHRPEDR